MAKCQLIMLENGYMSVHTVCILLWIWQVSFTKRMAMLAGFPKMTHMSVALSSLSVRSGSRWVNWVSSKSEHSSASSLSHPASLPPASFSSILSSWTSCTWRKETDPQASSLGHLAHLEYHWSRRLITSVPLASPCALHSEPASFSDFPEGGRHDHGFRQDLAYLNPQI